ncbi:MAG: Wzz/FepE/Etk N-terminal domain-containing protein [Candidatus Paceibacterota bacterium]
MDNKIEKEEVDLRDYVKFLFSRKRLVLGIFLAAITAAVIYNFLSPKIYELSVWLELGKVKDESLVMLIETPSQVAKKINSGIYEEFPYNAVVFNPSLTDLIQIKIESANVEQAKIDLKRISEFVLADHNSKIGAKKDALENEIKRLEENIDLLKEEDNNLELRIKTTVSEFDLFYLKDRLLELKSDIQNSYTKINQLKISLSDIQETKIVKPIDVSENPVEPKSLLNIILAGLVGLFIGAFSVFCRKWWKSPSK